jgi:hypothetical protein
MTIDALPFSGNGGWGVLGAHECLPFPFQFNRTPSCAKILGRIWTAPKRILKAFLHSRNTKMHRHECNTQLLFNLENQTKDFSYTIFPIKKNKSWAKF